jgi:hypothetical protein
MNIDAADPVYIPARTSSGSMETHGNEYHSPNFASSTTVSKITDQYEIGEKATNFVVNATNGHIQSVTITGDLSISFSNLTNMPVKLWVDNTGSYTVSLTGIDISMGEVPATGKFVAVVESVFDEVAATISEAFDE